MSDFICDHCVVVVLDKHYLVGVLVAILLAWTLAIYLFDRNREGDK